MEEKKHALLSASGSSRWMQCPPSARLEETVEEETSEYAREGTFAHALAELHINYYLGNIKKAQFNKEVKNLKQDSFYSEELMEYVQIYVDFGIEKINEARVNTKDAVSMVEMKLNYSEWVPEGFGTGDLVIITDDVIEIIDLKFGQGVPVYAIGNTQMRLYALGAIQQFGCLYDINTVKMTIIQPRLDNISTDDIAVDALLKWGEEDVKPKAELAIKGKGEFKAGTHCRFCRVKRTCRARAEENMKLCNLEFKQLPLLTDEEIVEVLNSIDELQKYASDVKEYALNKAINESKRWTGFKLVNGRSTRKYVDEAIVAKALIEAGFEEDKIYSKSLLTITAMEKAIGKKQFSELLKGLIEKPSGKPTLVPETDKRPEINNTAEADFREE
ncbi:MAG: DUF2800 domain-containing protein [Clostridium lundense]|nr:DUF2800 domain-containing protein [Clostridium lundense]